MEELRSAFSLNKEQQKAFNRLVKAYNDCKKLGVYFVDMYGTLYAYDRKLVNDYRDDKLRVNSEYPIELHGRTPGLNQLKIPNEWTDDNHIIGLTKLGYKYFVEYDEEQL